MSMSPLVAAFETDEEFATRMELIGSGVDATWLNRERANRQAAQWDRATRESLIVAINRLASAILSTRKLTPGD